MVPGGVEDGGKSTDGLAAELAQLALELGVTVRELHGHATETRTYSPDGTLLSVSFAEARFTPAEVGALLAARRTANEPRSRTGWKLSEATDKKNMGRFKLSDPLTDFALKAQVEGMEAAEKKYGEQMLKYLSFRVELSD